MKGFDTILQDEVISPSDTEAVKDSGKRKDALLNKKANNELVLSCSDETSFGIVEAAKTKDIKHGDAKLGWDTLTQRYEPDTGTELIKSKREYNSLTMNLSNDPDDYISKLDLYRSKMKKEHFNHLIDDEDFFIHILNTLPIQYDSVVEALERKLTKKTLTLAKMKVEGPSLLDSNELRRLRMMSAYMLENSKRNLRVHVASVVSRVIRQLTAGKIQTT